MSDATQSYFEGQWQMVRIIENIPAGVIGEVWGEATFMRDGFGLECRESGVLRFNGADYHTGRVSLWRFGEGGRIEVQYEDGRPFHDFLVQEPISLSLSGRDSFEVSYAFTPTTWTSRWEMQGDRVNYLMSTRYRAKRPVRTL